MNGMSLSRLYRRLTSGPLPLPADSERLVDAVSGVTSGETVVGQLAKSAVQSDLARMLSALRPESEALAQSMTRTVAAHPTRGRQGRSAAPPRRAGNAPLRWVGGLAACLAVALGLGLWHGEPPHAGSGDGTVASVTTAHQTDRIFTTRDEIFASSTDATPRKPVHAGDGLFKSNFQG